MRSHAVTTFLADNARQLLKSALPIAGIFVVVLLLSPLSLLAVGVMLDLPWRDLTDIGQSYTGVAAVLAGIALLLTARTVQVQARQTTLLQQQSVRQMQIELFKFPMADPIYLQVFGSAVPQAGEHDYARKSIFANLWLRYMQFGFLCGEISEDSLRYALRNEIFSTEFGLSTWERVRPAFEAGATTVDAGAFVLVVDREYELAYEARAPHQRGDGAANDPASQQSGEGSVESGHP